MTSTERKGHSLAGNGSYVWSEIENEQGERELDLHVIF